MSRDTAVLSETNHRRQRATHQWPDRRPLPSRCIMPKLSKMWQTRLLFPTSVVWMNLRQWVTANIIKSTSRTRNSLKCIIRCLHHRKLCRITPPPLWIRIKDFKVWSSSTLHSSTVCEQRADRGPLMMKEAHVNILKPSQAWVPGNSPTMAVAEYSRWWTSPSSTRTRTT